MTFPRTIAASVAEAWPDRRPELRRACGVGAAWNSAVAELAPDAFEAFWLMGGRPDFTVLGVKVAI